MKLPFVLALSKLGSLAAIRIGAGLVTMETRRCQIYKLFSVSLRLILS